MMPWLALGFAAFTVSRAAAGDATAGFPKSALAGWDALERAVRHSEGEFAHTEETKIPDKPFPTSIRHRRFAINDGAVFLVRIGETKEERVFCRNDEYSFHLRRLKGAAVYTIEGLFPPTEPGIEAQFNGHLFGTVGAAWRTAGRSLKDWLADPGTSVKSVKDDQGLVRAELDYDPAKGSNRETNYRRLSIRLDPARSWCIIDYIHTATWGTEEGCVEYGGPQRGLPVPRVLTRKLRSNKMAGVAEHTFTFDKFKLCDVPAQQFRLSAFGLPDMEPPLPKPTSRLWVWLAAAAAVLGVVAVLLRVRTRRLAMAG